MKREYWYALAVVLAIGLYFMFSASSVSPNVHVFTAEGWHQKYVVTLPAHDAGVYHFSLPARPEMKSDYRDVVVTDENGHVLPYSVSGQPVLDVYSMAYPVDFNSLATNDTVYPVISSRYLPSGVVAYYRGDSPSSAEYFDIVNGGVRAYPGHGYLVAGGPLPSDYNWAFPILGTSDGNVLTTVLAVDPSVDPQYVGGGSSYSKEYISTDRLAQDASGCVAYESHDASGTDYTRLDLFCNGNHIAGSSFRGLSYSIMPASDGGFIVPRGSDWGDFSPYTFNGIQLYKYDDQGHYTVMCTLPGDVVTTGATLARVGDYLYIVSYNAKDKPAGEYYYWKVPYNDPCHVVSSGWVHYDTLPNTTHVWLVFAEGHPTYGYVWVVVEQNSDVQYLYRLKITSDSFPTDLNNAQLVAEARDLPSANHAFVWGNHQFVGADGYDVAAAFLLSDYFWNGTFKPNRGVIYDVNGQISVLNAYEPSGRVSLDLLPIPGHPPILAWQAMGPNVPDGFFGLYGTDHAFHEYGHNGRTGGSCCGGSWKTHGMPIFAFVQNGYVYIGYWEWWAYSGSSGMDWYRFPLSAFHPVQLFDPSSLHFGQPLVGSGSNFEVYVDVPADVNVLKVYFDSDSMVSHEQTTAGQPITPVDVNGPEPVVIRPETLSISASETNSTVDFNVSTDYNGYAEVDWNVYYPLSNSYVSGYYDGNVQFRELNVAAAESPAVISVQGYANEVNSSTFRAKYYLFYELNGDQPASLIVSASPTTVSGVQDVNLSLQYPASSAFCVLYNKDGLPMVELNYPRDTVALSAGTYSVTCDAVGYEPASATFTLKSPAPAGGAGGVGGAVAGAAPELNTMAFHPHVQVAAPVSSGIPTSTVVVASLVGLLLVWLFTVRGARSV